MRKIIALLLTLACVGAFPANLAAQATRIIRIHFIGASQSSASESAPNDNFASFACQAAYDAVWQVEIPADDFPNAFGEPNVLTATGHTTYTTKSGAGDWSGDLSYDATPAYRPTAEPYNFNGDTVTLRIAAPHTVKAIRNDAAPPGLQRMLYTYSANTDKNDTVTNGDYTTTTTLSPVFPNLPGDPNTNFTPIGKGEWAVFPVSIANTPTTVSFTFEQTTTGPTSTRTIKWRGWAEVSVNPGPGFPAASNPAAFFQQTPPFTPQPASPGASPTPGGGSSPTPDDIVTQLERLPKLIQDLFDHLTDVIKEQSSKPAKSRSLAALRQSRAKTIVEVTSKIAVPVTGTLEITVATKKPRSQASQSFVLTTGARPRLRVTLPRALVRNLEKGRGASVILTAEFTPSSGAPKVTRTRRLSVPGED